MPALLRSSCISPRSSGLAPRPRVVKRDSTRRDCATNEGSLTQSAVTVRRASPYFWVVTTAKPCIAVVDDEEPVRTMLRRVLRLADYDVTTFGSGEAFLASLASNVPQCAILDVHMPGLSGLDVQTRLEAMRELVPAIFITASEDPALAETVSRQHKATLLRKPFSSDDLLEAVASALRGAATRDGE